MSLNVTVWNEFRHEKNKDNVRALYPIGIHGKIKEFLECDDINVTLASLDEPEQGITDEILNSTDVLIWWGHVAHGEVSDALVEYFKVSRNSLCYGMCRCNVPNNRTLTSSPRKIPGSSHNRLKWL